MIEKERRSIVLGEQIKHRYHYTGKLLTIQMGKLIFFMLFWSLFMYFILSNIYNRGLKLTLKLAGFSYLTAENIIPFLKKPDTICFILLFISTLILLIYIQFCMIITFFQQAEEKKQITYYSILTIGLKRALFIIKTGQINIILLSFLLWIVMNIVTIIGISLRIRIPNYFATAFFSLPYTKWSILAILIFLCLLGIYQYQTIFFTILTGFPNEQKRQWKTEKKQYSSILFSFIIWNLLLFCFLTLIYMLAIVSSAAVIIFLVDKNIVIAQFLSVYETINGIMIYIAEICCFAANMSFLFVSFIEQKGQQDIWQTEFFTETQLNSNYMLKRVIAVTLCIVVAAEVFYFYDWKRNGRQMIFNLEKVRVTCHRGNSQAAPENTIPALEEAIKEAGDYAEIDVQQTKDGVIVLMHDSNLKRTTGLNQYIWDVDFQQLQTLDAGSWFDSKFAHTKIPTLEETLEFCKGRINLNIEIKATKHSQELEKRVIDLIEEYDFLEQCVITSTSFETLKKVKEYKEEIKTGYIMAVAFGNFYDKEEIDFLSMRSSFVNQSVVRKAHSFGKEIHAWTVNSKKEMQRMKKIGVDNVITDRPIMARKVLYEEQSNRSLIQLINMVLG